VTRGIDEAEYRRLLSEHPPFPIEDEEGLERTEQRIWQLLDHDGRSPAEDAYLTILRTLVSAWEDEHVIIPDPRAAQADQGAARGARSAPGRPGPDLRHRVNRVRGALGQTAPSTGTSARARGLLPRACVCVHREPFVHPLRACEQRSSLTYSWCGHCIGWPCRR
jgi:hypothetical protein